MVKKMSSDWLNDTSESNLIGGEKSIEWKSKEGNFDV